MNKGHERSKKCYLLNRQGIKQKEIAKMMGVSTQRVSILVKVGEDLVRKESSWHAGLDVGVTTLLIKEGFTSKLQVIEAIESGYFFKTSIERLKAKRFKWLCEWAGVPVPSNIENIFKGSFTQTRLSTNGYKTTHICI